MLTGYGSKRSIWLSFAVIAGLAHGYALGETILGANADVTATYMAGALGIMVAITVAVMLATSNVLKIADAQSIFVRTAGGAVAAMGFHVLIGLLQGE